MAILTIHLSTQSPAKTNDFNYDHLSPKARAWIKEVDRRMAAAKAYDDRRNLLAALAVIKRREKEWERRRSLRPKPEYVVLLFQA